MHGRPENTRSIVEIAIGLDVDHDSIAGLRGERRAHRCRRAVTHAAGALASQVAVRLVVIPKLRVMAAREIAGRSTGTSLHS